METDIRDKVVEAAAKLFSDKGLAEVSLQEVAEAAGVDNSAVTALFDSKETLYGEVLKTRFGFFAEKMETALRSGDKPVKKIELFARAMCEVHRQSPSMFPLFYRELLNPSAFFDSVVKRNILHVAYLADNIIVKGIQKGTFKRGINPAVATMFFAGIFHYYFLAGRLTETLLPEYPNNDEEYLAQALRIYLNGLKKGV
jgi:TetR/AcrR family transcriptional regulator